MEKKNKNIFLYIVGGAFAGFFNGLFGSGGGSLIVPFMTEILKIPAKKAHANAILIIFFFTIVSLFFYAKNSMIDIKTALYVSGGGIAGGFLGGKFLSKISENILRKIFGVFMIIAAFKMVMK